ncbi:MAG: type II toxin-antitoxin system HicA family toxin [Bacteroidota bacterium]
MKTPRDISGKAIIKCLRVYGYQIVRQNGSHITITTEQAGEHHLTIPNHDPIKVGTINGIISSVATHFNISKEQVMQELFG